MALPWGSVVLHRQVSGKSGFPLKLLARFEILWQKCFFDDSLLKHRQSYEEKMIVC